MLAVIPITRPSRLRERDEHLVGSRIVGLSQQRASSTAVRIVAVQALSFCDGPVLPHGRGFLVARIADLWFRH